MMIRVWSKRVPTNDLAAAEEEIIGFLAGRGEGAENVSISKPLHRATADLRVYCADQPGAEALCREFGGDFKPLDNRDWTTEAPVLPPIKIRDSVLVVQSRDTGELDEARALHPGRVMVAIPPGAAFGAGGHATTSTCLRLLADAAARFRKAGTDWSFLDVGSGSGILAITSRLLGAGKILAVDNDPVAVRVAGENAGFHGASSIRFEVRDVLKWAPPGTWDVVGANIYAGVLERAMSRLAAAVSPGGVLILSGILRAQEADCLKTAGAEGFTPRRVVRKGKWVTAELFALRSRRR